MTKHIFSAFILAGFLAAHPSANAQASTLRIACNGNDVGADVSIDGQFKGECPLEAQVRAGTVKLRLVKKVDSLREQVFEQDIRIGDGVVKQIDVVLSVPRRIAEGQGRESKPPAAESTETGIRAQTDTAAPQGLTPPRPPIPLGISEDIWKIIEASEAYRNLPQPRAVKIVFQGKKEMEYTGSKIRSQPNPGAKIISTTRVTAPVGDKCTMTLTDSTTDGKPDGASGSYYCGSIWLGSASGGKPGMIVSSIDELKGSLFPMRVGARQTTRYQMAYLADRKYDSTHAADCAVVDRLAAQELDPRLTGAAWKVHCKSSYNASPEREIDNYYLEDLAVMLSSIGAYDSSKKAHVLPSAGTQTVIEAEGDYGSRNITSYASYNWEIGGVYEVPAQVATIAATANNGRPAAVRDESAQREQPQPARASDEATPTQQPTGAAAAADSADGMYELGKKYANGQGVTKNNTEAVSWYRKAADAGSAKGMYQLGLSYWAGLGVTKDEVEAVSWFRKAADAGSANGMFALGARYGAGRGVTKNYGEAMSWFRKAADAGNAKGMRALALGYANGEGVTQDYVEAVSWFRKSAAAGNAGSMKDLGYCLYSGLGVPKNETEGIEWTRRAAALGETEATRNLEVWRAEQAKRNSPQNTGTARAAQPASSGSGFFGAMIGSLASSVVDRTASQINSQAAGSGNAVLGALASANTQLANASKEQIARDMGSNDSVEGIAGAMVGNALGSGSRAGAVAALSGATNNLGGSALSGATSPSAGPVKAPSGSARIFVVSRKTKEAACEESKRMTKADGQQITGTCSCNTLFDSNNCRAQVVGESGPTVTASTKAAAEACERDYQGPGTDPQFDSYCKQAHFGQCLEKKTGVTTYRVEARTACNTLDRLLRATKGGRAAAYCTYCK